MAENLGKILGHVERKIKFHSNHIYLGKMKTLSIT